ncbi:unnamed protein product [Blepharisma stoltei]|uniref:Uncharacterized protein n=1 Tax=Blepharisma stoltei TaxID=1481888 RepID=A0AAU9IDT5_9CILI|nr:unnamed protein product [Blepharisma stoltei]
MTSFKEAQAKGLRWPEGPDDLCPSKIENTYLYGGGRTRKFKILLAEISIAWGAFNVALDKYLLKNRHNVKNNFFLERTMIWSSRYYLPCMLVLWGFIPISQATYWWVLWVSVGAKPNVSRDPVPKWKPGENPFYDKAEED